MKPAYWTGILALVGGVVGHAVSQATGWFGTVLGIVPGILVGAMLYLWQSGRGR